MYSSSGYTDVRYGFGRFTPKIKTIYVEREKGVFNVGVSNYQANRLKIYTGIHDTIDAGQLIVHVDDCVEPLDDHHAHLLQGRIEADDGATGLTDHFDAEEGTLNIRVVLILLSVIVTFLGYDIYY